jgi:hypothetical protein
MKNGILVHNDTVQGLKDGISLCLAHYGKKSDRAHVNKKIIQERFSRDDNIREYHLLYEHVLNVAATQR